MLTGYTSSTPAVNLFNSRCHHRFFSFPSSSLFFFLRLRTQKMSLFSWKSVRRGSNQRLSFLGEPRAFLRKAPELSAFVFSFAFLLLVFFVFLLLGITEPSVDCFQVLIRAATVWPCPASHTNGGGKFEADCRLNNTAVLLLFKF